MNSRWLLGSGLMLGLFLSGFALGTTRSGDLVASAEAAPAPQAAQVFELRTYTAADGKFEHLGRLRRGSCLRRGYQVTRTRRPQCKTGQEQPEHKARAQ